MALPTSYMTGNFTKIPQYFATIMNAQAPEKFTVKFLKDLGFTSSTDIQFINVLKVLNFLDDSGTPTELYYRLFDQSVAKGVIAQQIRIAYADLFALNTKSQEMSTDELKGKFKQLTGGQKSDSTLRQMVSTFTNLCSYADWNVDIEESQNTNVAQIQRNIEQNPTPESLSTSTSSRSFDLNYDIHIHLPATRDQAVYDALFASLAKHIPLK